MTGCGEFPTDGTEIAHVEGEPPEVVGLEKVDDNIGMAGIDTIALAVLSVDLVTDGTRLTISSVDLVVVAP